VGQQANSDLKATTDHFESGCKEQPGSESTCASSNESKATRAAERATGCQVGTSLQGEHSHVIDAFGPLHHEACNDTRAGAHATSCQSQASLQAEQKSIDAIHTPSTSDAPQPMHSGACISTVAGEHASSTQVGTPLHNEQNRNKVGSDAPRSDAPRSDASSAVGAVDHEAWCEQANAGSIAVLPAACYRAQGSSASTLEVSVHGGNAGSTTEDSSRKDPIQALPARLFCSDELTTVKDGQSLLKSRIEDMPCMPPAACNIPQNCSEPALGCTALICDEACFGTEARQPKTKVELQEVEETQVALFAGELLVWLPVLICIRTPEVEHASFALSCCNMFRCN
jgi:hypothetical protein